ncbi:MAG: cytochrome c oxidase accessory protein CcoG [Chlorobi bacterium]|nr:cytochrome c oxidase accessory protein CcoG [Chlorobiota bacterium]
MNESEKQINDESFRDRLGTVTEEGERIWVYPQKPKGKFYNARTIVSIILLAVLFGVPFISYNGHPFMLFNILNREFIIFGMAFGPQDFHLFVISIIIGIIGIFLFTVVWGRIFCGWVCPQTIFMEMVFRKIEYLIEGGAAKQRALNKAPWNGEKIFKKALKHAVFFGLAFLIANALLAWIIGIEGVKELASAPIASVSGPFIAMIIFTAITYFFGAYFREQVCTVICPYGRLQGVMLDQNSIVIAYDYKRGEPRGNRKKNEETDLGDCIDCNQCVVVCPTGIDIRNGTQLECVNCTACIDACDDVMTKINKPKGLIRYASKEEIETGVRKIFTPKSIGYSVVLFLLFGLLTFLLATRTEVELSILRTAGLMAQEQPDGRISNLYDVKITNKTFTKLYTKLELIDVDGDINIVGGNVDENGRLIVPPHQVADAKFFVVLPKEEIKSITIPIKIGVAANGKVIDVIKTSFLGKVQGHKK